MLENIIFGIMLLIVLGAGVMTFIYEASGTSKQIENNENRTEQEESK